MVGNYTLAKRAGWIAIVCGCFQILYGILSIFFPYSSGTYYGWDEALWIVASSGMAFAIIGILALDAGKPRWLAWSGGIFALVGIPIRIVASVIFIMQSSWDPIALILLSILLLLGGMAAVGIALLRGDKINGWQAWTPILVSLTGLAVTVLYSVSLFIHFIALGLWGLTWMLVGYVVITHVSKHEAKPKLVTA
ncbi:MAG: hypothetical protein AAFV98_02710 [Chloroflexota bacterium]